MQLELGQQAVGVSLLHPSSLWGSSTLALSNPSPSAEAGWRSEDSHATWGPHSPPAPRGAAGLGQRSASAWHHGQGAWR